MLLGFSEHGPFDAEEQRVVRAACEAVADTEHPHAEALLLRIAAAAGRLDDGGQLLSTYPSLFEVDRIGDRTRDLSSLLDTLAHSNPATFEMCLPARVPLARSLALGEVNFYRLLRMVCADTLVEDPALLRAHTLQIDRLLCNCLYARLAETVLVHIASDQGLQPPLRERAGLSLAHIWEQSTYRIDHYFPVLQSTWEARRRVPVTLGTLLGTSEMFSLIMEGADELFLDYLVDAKTPEETDALREFLFGATTEELRRLQARIDDEGALARVEDGDLRQPMGADPALAMYEFFLSRHLQAAARRQATIPGPKRTAEEFVLLYYLDDGRADEALSQHPTAPPRPL